MRIIKIYRTVIMTRTDIRALAPESLISPAFAFVRGARGLTSAETYFSVGPGPPSGRTRGTTEYVDEIS